MNIPQEELDKLNESDTSGLFEEHVEVEDETPEEEVIEPKVEEKVSESPDEDSVGDKPRVPYSRFETVQERAIRAEERLAILEEQEKARNENTESYDSISVPDEWKELYGDSDEARKAYSIQLRLNEKNAEETTKKVLESIKQEQIEQEQVAKQNLDYIESNIARLEESLGKKLTEAEESSILDIQDEFTPKDSDGNYVAPLLDAEKAYEIYTLRGSTAKAEKIQIRRKVVSITSSNSEGESSNKAFENYRPGEGGLWRDKL